VVHSFGFSDSDEVLSLQFPIKQMSSSSYDIWSPYIDEDVNAGLLSCNSMQTCRQADISQEDKGNVPPKHWCLHGITTQKTNPDALFSS
jgi:hypothetical protein